jgi:hypothetical protein
MGVLLFTVKGCLYMINREINRSSFGTHHGKRKLRKVQMHVPMGVLIAIFVICVLLELCI